jgi:putative Mg2+ transporter-C (MgtC) family protein
VTHDFLLVGRLAVSFALTFVLGYERELRGSTAGDRTFALVGIAGGVIGLLAEHNAPTALAGAITGVGFIGAGLLFRQNPPQATAQDPIAPASRGGRSQSQLATLHGVTTAATILAAAVIGACAGEGLMTLEMRYIPGLRRLDAGRFADRFVSDDEHHSH